MDVWMFVVGVLLSVIGFLGVWVLNSIRSEMSDIKVSLNSLERDLRGGVAMLDRRVTIVETQCIHHNKCEQ